MPALVSDWFEKFSEPIRVRSRLPAFSALYIRDSRVGPFPELLNDWFQPFSEPVRCRSPLSVACIPYYFELINFVGFSFSLSEFGDTIALSLTVHTPKNLAKATITELRLYASHVTIHEIRYTKGYS